MVQYIIYTVIAHPVCQLIYTLFCLQVQPIIEHLNEVSKLDCNQEFSSVDEIMVPYYGKPGDKQFIRGKPIRFGFKLWAICTADGSLLHVEPYCGAHTRISDRGLGQGPNVVHNSCKMGCSALELTQLAQRAVWPHGAGNTLQCGEGGTQSRQCQGHIFTGKYFR